MSKVMIHKELCSDMHILYERKNADYGDSFAQMRQRYPNVIGMKLWEKVNRLCTLLDSGKQEVPDESVEDTLMDIANYAIMELTERRVEHKKNKPRISFKEGELNCEGD